MELFTVNEGTDIIVIILALEIHRSKPSLFLVPGKIVFIKVDYDLAA